MLLSGGGGGRHDLRSSPNISSSNQGGRSRVCMGEMKTVYNPESEGKRPLGRSTSVLGIILK
jgi:hypothetical protein